MGDHMIKTQNMAKSRGNQTGARSFAKNGLAVSKVPVCGDTLEDFFKEMDGGEGIA